MRDPAPGGAYAPGVRALVTGGAGFIGSHLADALLAAGDEVTVVDHLRGHHRDNLVDARRRGAVVVRADVTDLSAMTQILSAVRPDVVHHLAAFIDVRRSMRDPVGDVHANVGGTASVLEAARRASVGRVVLASTAAVYGDPATLPTAESCPLAPLSPYGAGKAAAESYLELFGRVHGLPALALRMANVYGPRQDPHGEAGIVAILSGALAEGRVATIFGDGRQTRDYVYVADVAAAFVAAGRAEATGALNVSTGRETSLRELAATLGVATSRAAARPGDGPRSCLDPAAAAATLGWRARVPLEDGLQRTLAALATASPAAPSL
jgi:UDP-glucose 4-epimerase